MKNLTKTQSTIIYAIIMIALGVAFIIGGVDTAGSIMGIVVTIIGALTIVSGVFSIFTFQPIVGAIEIAVGIVLIVFAWTIAWIAFFIFGFGLAIYGFMGIIKKNGSIIANICALGIGILIVCMGFGVKGAWDFINVFYYVVGALMIIDGVIMLFRRN